MQTRFAWALSGVVVWMVGCGQLLGLDGYIEPPDGGPANRFLDAGIDATVADQATASPDAPSEVGSDLGNDAGVPTDATSILESAVDPANDAAPEATFDGGGTPDGEAGDAQIVPDGAVDGAFDAPADAFVCPPQCNSGCGDGGACLITITSPAGDVTCPPGLACQVHCLGTQVCQNMINCAAGQPCKVTCDGDQACNSNNINQGTATSLCLDCLSTMNFRSCNFVTCAATTCSIRCGGGGGGGGGGGCGGSCGNCTRVFACP